MKKQKTNLQLILQIVRELSLLIQRGNTTLYLILVVMPLALQHYRTNGSTFL